MMKTFVAVGFLALAASIPVHAHEATSKISRPVHEMSSPTEFDGNDLAVDELLKIAFNEEESLRVAAVQVMGEYHTSRARAALGITLYGNSMGTVRATAADQLGDLGDSESVYALALAMETERDAEVRDVIRANIEKNVPSDPPLAVAGNVFADEQ